MTEHRRLPGHPEKQRHQLYSLQGVGKPGKRMVQQTGCGNTGNKGQKQRIPDHD